MSARERPPEGRDPRSVTEAAERLAAIVEAAEQAASRVIDDAEAEARRRLDDAEARAERLVAEKLRELADQIDPAGDQGGTVTSLRPVDLPSKDESAREPQSEEAGDQPTVPPRRSESAGARLLATQMAVSGASREEIGKRLRNGFEIADTSEILDAILGPEG